MRINKGIEKAQGGIEKYGEKGVKLGAEYTKMIYVKANQVHPALGLVVLLIFLIIGIVIMLLIANAVHQVVGFFTKPFGIVTLLLFVGAIGIYAYLRYIGIKLNGWLGAIIEISLLFFGLVFFVGASEMLMGFFMWIMPIVIIGAVLYFFYRGVQSIKNPTIKVFTIAMAIVFVISAVLFNTFIVPYTVGTQKLIEINVAHTERDSGIVITEHMSDVFGTMSLTTSMNPFIIGLGEMSQNMWKYGDIHEYIVDWQLKDMSDNYKLIASGYNIHIYIVGDGETSIYSVVYTHKAVEQYYDYMLTVKVYDEHHVLLQQEEFHLYGLHQS